MISKRNIVILVTVIAAGGVVGGWSIWYFTQPPTLLLQTTTSMNDSGLLDRIAPAFLAATGIQLKWVSAGTGQALLNAAQGDGDVVIVHSVTAENDFINHSSPGPSVAYAGNGIMRASFAYNFFIIVGPIADPAGVKTNAMTNGTKAFQLIYAGGENGNSTFASRGDGSGTQSKENSTWDAAGKGLGYDHKTVQTKTWYKSTGTGMGNTLTYANEIGAYTLTDYGTWLNLRSQLTSLTNLTSFAIDLRNIYSIIAVDPAKHSNVWFEGAKQLIYFMLTEGQNVIGNYTIDGEQPFTKNVTIAGTCFCHSPLCEVENKNICEHLQAPYPPGCASVTMAVKFQASTFFRKPIEVTL